MTVGDTLTVGTGARKELVTVTSVGTAGASGTGVNLAAPLRFDHMSGVDVSDVGTGISFSPATKFPHVSGDAVQALGSGITLDRPLGQKPRVRRGRGQPAGHDGGLPGTAGAQSVVRRRALRQGRLDRAAGRQRRGGRRRHGLRIPAEQLERQRDHRQPRARHPRGRPRQGRLHRGGAQRWPGALDRPRLPAWPTGAWAAFRTALDTDSLCTDFLLQPATTLPAAFGRRRDQYQSRQRGRLWRRPDDS